MTDDILTKLAAPFPPEVISWRVGSTTGDKKKGMALAYIDARDVQDRLNQVCGLDWQVRHPWAFGSKLACEIGIKIDGEWIWRGDGAGDSDVEAEKGAFSDSFKRAAVRFGIGRYLYDMDSPWVELKPMGKSYAIADGEHAKLRALLTRKSGGTAPKVERAPAAPASDGQKKAASADDLKQIAESIAGRIKTAPHALALDNVMDDSRADLGKLPRVTFDFLNNLYQKRKTEMAETV